MATNYATNANNAKNSEPIVNSGIGDDRGVVRSMYDKFTLTADLAANDIIVIGAENLPAGARVVGYYLNHDDLDAAGGTLDLGWAASADGGEAADDNGFLSAVDVTSAGLSSHEDGFAQPGYLKKFTESVEIQVKVNGDTDATSGDIEVCILYVVD